MSTYIGNRPWVIFDSQGFYQIEPRGEVVAKAFCDTYNARNPDDPLRPYTCCALDDVQPPTNVAVVPSSAAALVRHRSLRTRAEIAFDGQDHFSDWSQWEPVTLAYALAVTDPARNTPALYEMQPLYEAPSAPVLAEPQQPVQGGGDA